MKIFKCKHPFIMKGSPFKSEGEKLVDDQVEEFATAEFDTKLKGGTIPGMFAIPMGVYNRYQEYKQSIQEQGPQTSFDKQKIQSYKFSTEE